VPPQLENAAAIEEAGLLALAGQGNREAFRLLYVRYSAPLFSLAVRFVGDTGEAEELLQDAFVKIWRNAALYDPHKSRPFTWAVTITRRTCIDHLRKRRRIPATTPLPDDAGAPADFSVVGDGQKVVEAREDAERLSGALAGVPANPRSALELALFSELTHSEIARRLEQPVGTVKSWIRRGLLDLREALKLDSAVEASAPRSGERQQADSASTAGFRLNDSAR
jgi:RNA polymerase sigma-70 factor (ECF subfamily)